MTPEQRQQLDSVNLEVNQIPYQDLPGPGELPESYRDETVPGDSWVCRNYAERKATLLRERYGWAGADLTIVLCYVETGDRHAVLRAMADGEPWILDSRFNDITPMYPPRPGYKYEAAQIAGTTQFEALA